MFHSAVDSELREFWMAGLVSRTAALYGVLCGKIGEVPSLEVIHPGWLD
ncbi:MAG: hypothetical protein ABIT23_00675 [Nitrosospira sp.]